MDTQTYATDLSDAQRELLRPLVEPPARLSRPGHHAPRTALNALPCVLRRRERVRLGRDPKLSAGSIARQSVKTTAAGFPIASGYPPPPSV